jgi:hypothetical protein
VDEGCDETLGWWPCKDAGVLPAGDLYAKGRLELLDVPGRGDAINLPGVERWALGVETACDLVGVAIAKELPADFCGRCVLHFTATPGRSDLHHLRVGLARTSCVSSIADGRVGMHSRNQRVPRVQDVVGR